MKSSLVRTGMAGMAVAAVLATVTACGDGGSKVTVEKPSVSPSAPSQATIDKIKVGAAYLNAERSFELDYDAAQTASETAASAGNIEEVVAQYRKMRDALFAFDGDVRKMALDDYRVQRDAVLTAIAAEIATLDRITQGERTAALVAQAADQHQALIKAKIALAAAVK